jgi:hypothetical protein
MVALLIVLALASEAEATGNGDLGFYTDSSIGGAPTVLIRNISGDFGVQGNATQGRDRGGFVKAMAYVNGDATLVRCYNGITGSSSGSCGFGARRISGFSGSYVVDFGFQVSDRFVSIGVESAGISSVPENNAGISYKFSADSSSELVVFTYEIGAGTSDRPFMVIVY